MPDCLMTYTASKCNYVRLSHSIKYCAVCATAKPTRPRSRPTGNGYDFSSLRYTGSLHEHVLYLPKQF